MDNSNNIGIWTSKAIEDWEASNTKLYPGLALFQIMSAEEILQFKFPADFIELYQLVNGFRDLDWNEHMFSFWSLEKIIEEYKADDRKDFVGFCDFLIHSHSIGFSKNNLAIYKSYDRHQPIAGTFKEAVMMINQSSNAIY